MTLVLKDGSSHTAQVDVPKGDPRDPMTRDEIKVKFDALGREVVGQAKCDAAGELIMGIENEKDLKRFFEVLTL